MTHLSSGNYSDQQKSPDNGHTRDIMQLQHAAPERRATVLVFSMLAVLEATRTDRLAGGDGSALELHRECFVARLKLTILH